MRVVSRFSGATAILLVLAGCAVQSHTEVAIPVLPGCEETHARLVHPGVTNEPAGRIPGWAPGPMRLCRYRWDNLQNKLTLIADITRPLAPVALLHEFSALKSVYQVYGPNAEFPCPLSQGNVDLVIFRAALGPDLTIIGVQRDGCGRVGITHDNFATYIAYLGSNSLSAQLDAMNPTSAEQAKNVPKIRVTPSINLHGGEQILVQVLGASPGERFRISECATAASTNIAGCGDQLAAQPFIDIDSSGAGSTTFYVQASAATKPYSTTAFRPCANKCVIMAVGAFEGTSTFVYAPLKFSP
jgi:hypothetical protein